MTTILGISAFYHDSAAAIIVDGEIVAAAEEERFSRIKHDSSFPVHAIDYCLRQAHVGPQELDFVGFYEKPLLKFERLMETYLTVAPRGLSTFLRAIPEWANGKLFQRREIKQALPGYRNRVIFAEHHESHAASAFFASPFEQAAILTVDGVGEWATATLGHGAGNRFDLTHEMRYPHSLGLLYSAFTYHCGFRVNSGEYKLMGLAVYGKPTYYDQIMERLLDLKDDGSFRLDLSYFDFCHGWKMTSAKFDREFGGPARKPESDLTQREMDLAASIQKVTETILLRMVEHAHQQTGAANLCLAGGVALNCVANASLLENGPFEKIWVQPAAGDSGGAIGVAWLIWHQLLGNERTTSRHDHQQQSRLGPSFSNAQIERRLRDAEVEFEKFANENELLERIAKLLAEQKIVGWYQGRMEFGPRALGGRSILADPRSASMKDRINLRVKNRESFRPFAPAILKDQASQHYEVPGIDLSYMTFVCRAKQENQLAAVIHGDGTSRVQVVGPDHGRFYRLLVAFEKQTGCPALLNTSFNVRGNPIVCSPTDAIKEFELANLDALILEDFLVLKGERSANE